MILNEFFGNLRAVSPEILSALKDNGPSISYMVGPNSVVNIVKQEDSTPLLKSANPEEIPVIILRFKQEDEIMFVINGYDRKRYSYRYITTNRKWKNYFDLRNKIELNKGFEKNIFDVWNEGYADVYPKFEDFASKVNYQFIYADKERFEKINKRRDEKGFYLKTSSNGQKLQYKFGDKAKGSKIHGSLIDTRDKDWYHSRLKERLKAYVESKFPTFNTIEDLDKANMETILKAFRIGDNVYSYSVRATNDISSYNEDPLYSLYKNKFSYIGYEINRQNQGFPTYIYFKIILDGSKVKVRNIFGSDLRGVEFLQPLSRWFKKQNTEEKSDKKEEKPQIDDLDW